MLSILLTGLLSAAAPQSAPVPAAPPPPAAPAAPLVVPADVDPDAACLMLTTQLGVLMQKMPADQQAKMGDFKTQIDRAISFYLGAVSARRSDSEVRTVVAKAMAWARPLNQDERSKSALSCFTVIGPRGQVIAAAVGAAG